MWMQPLLLFLVGLELNPRRLWDLRREIFGFGLAQVVFAGLAITGVVWAFCGFSPKAALALGLPLALSSTAQVLPLLRSQGRLHTPFGERGKMIGDHCEGEPRAVVIETESGRPDISAAFGRPAITTSLSAATVMLALACSAARRAIFSSPIRL